MGPASTARPCPLCGYALRSESCEACGGEVLAAPDGSEVRPGNRFFLLDVGHGFATFFWAGLLLLTRREYFGKLALAVAVNFVVLAALFVGCVLGLHELFAGLIAADWGWLDFLRGSLSWAGAFLMTVITLLLLGPAIIETVMGPFLDGIADATEKMLAGPGVRAVHQSTWDSIVLGVRSSAQVVAMQVLVLIPCLLLSMCGVGLVLAILLSAFLNALLWFEIPFARRGWPLRERIAVVRHNWPRALGFGLAFEVGLFIPFFNFLLLCPTAAVAVSMLYFHLDKDPSRA